MDPTKPGQGGPAPVPHRGALITVIMGYSTVLIAILCLVASHLGHVDQAHPRMAGFGALVRRSPWPRRSGHLSARPSWRTVRPAHRTVAWRLASRPRTHARWPSLPRASTPRRARRWVQQAKRGGAVLPPAEPRTIHIQRWTPLVAWVHPPDPSLPPECRPPAPTLFVRRF
jgi:hypothetical protein